jgi:hypothetical protein
MDLSTLLGRRRKMREARGPLWLVKGTSDPYADILVSTGDPSSYDSDYYRNLASDSMGGEFWKQRGNLFRVKPLR